MHPIHIAKAVFDHVVHSRVEVNPYAMVTTNVALAGLFLWAAKNWDMLRNRSITDRLTGIPNRAGLEDKIQEIIDKSKSGKISASDQVAIVSIDLNGFKKINDTYGHQAGDLALQHFSKKLRGFLPSDIFLARPGGDEFVITVTGHSAAFEAYEAMRKFKVELDKDPLILEGVKLPIKFSYGIDTIHAGDIVSGDITKDNIWTKADKIMYHHKKRRATDKLSPAV